MYVYLYIYIYIYIYICIHILIHTHKGSRKRNVSSQTPVGSVGGVGAKGACECLRAKGLGRRA